MDINFILDELVKLDNKDDKLKKQRIRELADELSRLIKEKNLRILNQLKIINEPEEDKSILSLVKWYRNKYKLSFSTDYISKCIPNKYVKVREPKGGESPIIRLSQNYVKEHLPELQEMIKEVTRGAAQDIKIKIRKDTIDLQGWKSPISLELVELAKKIDEQETVDPEMEKEIVERLRMIRDGRFATTWSHYEAIIVACNTTKSLTHAIAEEHRPLTRVEIIKNEGSCRECFCEGAPNKCNCHCHRTVQQMTTKGLKWAIKHNKRLGEFDEHFKRIGNTDHDDVCPHIKSLFSNPNMDKHLSQDNKMDLLTKHIDTEQCIRCEMFLNEHPEFFTSGK